MEISLQIIIWYIFTGKFQLHTWVAMVTSDYHGNLCREKMWLTNKELVCSILYRMVFVHNQFLLVKISYTWSLQQKTIQHNVIATEK